MMARDEGQRSRRALPQGCIGMSMTYPSRDEIRISRPALTNNQRVGSWLMGASHHASHRAH